MAIVDGLQSVFSIMLMMGVGYFLTGKGWFDEKVSKLFSKLVVGVSLPCLAFSNLLNIFDRENLVKAGIGLLIPFISMLIGYCIGMLTARVLNVPKRRRGLFQSMFALSNTIFIGLPINVALFGDESIPYVLIYYAANTIMFWTIGVYGIRETNSEKNSKITILESIRKIFSPPLIAFLMALVFILLKIKPPKFVMDAAVYIGNLTTPLSMIFIGIIIYYMDLKKFNFNLEMIFLLTGRFIISPLLVMLLVQFFDVLPLMKKVFTIESAMPAMTQTAIVAQVYDSDYEYATWIVSISTLISLIFIPFYRVFIEIL